MAVRDQYQKLIDRKRSELESLRAQVAAAEGFISGMTEAMRLLPRVDGNESDTVVVSQTLREGSKLAKARDFLAAKGSPQHINHILTAVGESGKEARVGLTGSIAQYARLGKVFTKTGSNEFGLIQFSANSLDADVEEGETDSGGITDDDIPF